MITLEMLRKVKSLAAKVDSDVELLSDYLFTGILRQLQKVETIQHDKETIYNICNRGRYLIMSISYLYM